MATSGVTSFNVTVLELIKLAMLDIGALAIGESPTPDEEADAILRLNMLLANLMIDSIYVHKNELKSFNTVANAKDYYLADDTLKVLSVFLSDPVTGQDTPLNVYTLEDYDDIPQKNVMGIPNSVVVNYATTPVSLSLYPIPEGVYTIRFRALSQFESVTDASETLNFPVTGLPLLQRGLAYFLANSYRLPIEERGLLAEEFSNHKIRYLAQDKQRVGHEVVVPKGIIIV
jgi:hypothetical protein